MYRPNSPLTTLSPHIRRHASGEAIEGLVDVSGPIIRDAFDQLVGPVVVVV